MMGRCEKERTRAVIEVWRRFCRDPSNRSYHTDSKGPTLEQNPRGHDVSCPYTSKPRTNREVGHYKTTLLQGLGAAME
jgi:hypothetical protein